MSSSSSSSAEIAAIESLIADLDLQGKACDFELDGLLHRQEELSSELELLADTRLKLFNTSSRVEELSQLLTGTSAIAASVSSRIRQLDSAKSLAEDILRRVEGITDLKRCVEGVDGAVERGEYESAADFVQRLLKHLAEGAADSAMVESTVARFAQVLRVSLRSSMQGNDFASAKQHATLFPRIGMAAEGLEAFVKSIQEMTSFELMSEFKQQYEQIQLQTIPVAEPNDSNNSNSSNVNILPLLSNHSSMSTTNLMDMCTQVMDTVAAALESAEPMTDSIFGPGSLVAVARGLQSVCDKFALPFIRSFIDKARMAQMAKELTPPPVSSRQQPSLFFQQLIQDPRHLDGVLEEAAEFSRRAEMYDKFIHSKASNSMHSYQKALALQTATVSAHPSHHHHHHLLHSAPSSSSSSPVPHRSSLLQSSSSSPAIPLSPKIDPLPRVSDFHMRIQEMMSFYVQLEESFMLASIQKSIQMDELPSVSSSAAIDANDDDDARGAPSSMVDDVFFILKKVSRRAAQSESVMAVCAVVNHVNGVLRSKYKEELQRRLWIPPSMSGKRSFLSFLSSASQSGGILSATSPSSSAPLSSSSSSSSSSSNLSASSSAASPGPSSPIIQFFASEDGASLRSFLVAVNSMSTSAEYVIKLKQDLDRLCDESFGGDDSNMLERIRSCSADLQETARVFEDALRVAIEQTASSLSSSDLNSLIDEFQQFGYELSEEDLAYAAADASSVTYVQRFVSGFEHLMVPSQRVLSSTNFDTLLQILVNHFTRRLESLVLQKRFNQTGALQFDKDIRALMMYFSSISQRTVRDRFTCLSQIGSLLSLERVQELQDFWQEGQWKLSPQEAKRILALRLDFKTETINQLKL